ncbi:hypothetical protein CBR_g1174 [Chara braunii]|uniref:Uncharacterized protein n=1 Tax=Chara braunii TaxID=69332 RepID=A0A388KDN1_CHABU|nr:hypothetical protein CBR_g1174 [Chara braunii]|eukprot:GBG68053.1 hypothetical protein CBR_g1174 [Chara braunii]
MVGLEDEEEHGHIAILNFRRAFHGSVFEKYHVLPLQLAGLDVSGAVTKHPVFEKIGQFLLRAGNVNLLMRDRETFSSEFVNFCNATEEDTALVSDCRDAVDVASDYIIAFGKFEEGEDAFRDRLAQTTGYQLGCYRCFGAQTGYQLGCYHCFDTSDVARLVGLCMVKFALSNSMRLLRRLFRRSGMDVTHECDETLARKLFQVCRTSAPHNDYSASMTHAQLIDFDLVGVDGRHFPLRMILTGRSFQLDAWYAEVSDRQTGSLIARAVGENAHRTPDDRDDQTRLEIVDANVIEERYKPHGDVPTMLPRVTTSSYYGFRRCYKHRELDEDEHVRLYFEECRSEGIIFSNIGNEEMKSLYHLREVQGR